MINLDKNILRLARNIPVIHVLLCAWSAYDPLDWFDAGNFVGHSVLVTSFYIIVCVYCKEFKNYLYPLVFSTGMLFISLIDSYGRFFKYKEYAAIYDIGIALVCLFISIVLISNRKKKQVIKRV